MGLNPEDEKTLTIAQRTRKNLNYIYQKKSENEDVEEFTQLINSMLGMVICLREDYFKGSEILWSDINKLGPLSKNNKLVNLIGKPADTTSPKLKQTNSFSQLITRLRHGFAHNCFDLEVDARSRQITGVIVWNIRSNNKNKPENRVWEQRFSEQELKDLAYLFVDYLEKELT